MTILIFQLKKTHVVVNCKSAEFESWARGIDRLIRACSSMGIPSHGEILKEFFGGDGAEEAIMMVRANYFNCLVEPGSLTPWAVWVSQMGWGWGLSDLFYSSLSFISDIYYGFSVLQNLLNLSLNYPSHWN